MQERYHVRQRHFEVCLLGFEAIRQEAITSIGIAS